MRDLMRVHGTVALVGVPTNDRRMIEHVDVPSVDENPVIPVMVRVAMHEWQSVGSVLAVAVWGDEVRVIAEVDRSCWMPGGDGTMPVSCHLRETFTRYLYLGVPVISANAMARWGAEGLLQVMSGSIGSVCLDGDSAWGSRTTVMELR